MKVIVFFLNVGKYNNDVNLFIRVDLFTRY